MNKLSIAVAALLLTACAKPTTLNLCPANGQDDVNPDTRLVITFAGAPNLGEYGKIRVFDAADDSLIDSLDISIPAGPTEGRTYGPECDYISVPYDYSRSFVPTNRNTLPGTPSGGAEPTSRDMQLTIIGGFTDGFRFHPVIINGNSATIYLHNNMLEYGHKYYVTIDKEVFSEESFKGIAKGEWSFRTKKSGPADPYNLSVEADGSGDFNTVQGALDAVADFCDKTTVISVGEGDFEEIVYARNKTNVTIKGKGMNKTKVHYANNEVFNPHPLNIKTNEKRGTYPSRRAAFALDNCHDIQLYDLTIATDSYGQAEGLLLNGERIACYGIRVIGSGDALQANGTIYMENCEVEGDGDTILGRGSIFAYRSTFKNHGGPLSWVRNFKPDHGDVFLECHFEGTKDNPADFGRVNINFGQSYPDAEFVLLNCTTRHIIPQGWSSIAHQTCTMLEYNTKDADTGMPVDYSQRHEYSRVLDAEKDSVTIANYSNPAYVLNGWEPLSLIN